ncbi:MAG TPA: ferritin family protein [Candidatus Methylomirabilis sp.]
MTRTRPSPPSLADVLGTLVRLEERAARLYTRFYRRFRAYPAVADAWWDLAMDEYGHAGILRAAQELVDPAQRADALAGRVRPLVRILRACERRGTGAISLRTALDLAVTIESSELDQIGNEVIRSLRRDLPEMAQKAFGTHDAHLQRLTRAVGKFGDEAQSRRVAVIRRSLTR